MEITTRGRLRQYRQFVELWAASGLEAQAVRPLAAALERCEAVDGEYKQIVEGRGGGEVAGQVADGSISFAEGVRRAAALAAAVEPVSSSYRARRADVLHDAVMGSIHASVARFFTKNGDGLLARIEAELKDVEKQMAPLSVLIEGVPSAEAAIVAGPKVGEAWTRISELASRRSALFQVRHVMGPLGVSA